MTAKLDTLILNQEARKQTARLFTWSSDREITRYVTQEKEKVGKK